MEQLSLFDGTHLEKKHENSTTNERTVPALSAQFFHVEKEILHQLGEGKSVVEVCKWLIQYKDFSDATYSQGTLKLFPMLMQHLTVLEKEKRIELVEVDSGMGRFLPYQENTFTRKADARYKIL